MPFLIEAAGTAAISQLTSAGEKAAENDDHLIQLWLHGRAPHTQRAYRADVNRFRSGAGKPFQCITLSDLQQFADSLAYLSPASRYRTLSSIKSLLAFGHRIGYLPFDVGRVLRLPSVRNNLAGRILSEADLHRMLTLEPDERNRMLLVLLYASGVRRGELADLRWKDLQATGEGGQITVFGKGGKTRSIQLPESVWKQLLALRGAGKDEDPVFPSRKKGKPLTDSAIWRIVKKAASRAGLATAISPHWLRHGHASHALDRGAPIHLVQATLGHASVATTGRYLHARPKESSSKFLAL
jgi:integrase/recombinase XerD